jgi:outer membrane autotransporter protein
MVNDNVLVGAAGGYSTASVDKDNGASADASTRQGALYTTVAGESWFFDSSLVCGLSSIDQDLGNVFDTTASYDAQNVALYVGVGHETVGQYLVITPQAGLLANYYRQDGYTEESDNSIAREVSGYDALYLQSLLGCSIGLYMTVGEVTVRPDFRVRWLHEFNADEEDVDCNLIGSTVPMVMTMQSREADVLQFGAGFAVKLSEALECRMDLDLNTFGGGTRYDIGGKLIYQF